MIPGTTTKLTESKVASAATIHAKTDALVISGAVQINNIVPYFGGGNFSGLLFVTTEGAVVLGTTGNIAGGITTVAGKLYLLVYFKSLNKWAINAG